MVANAQCSGYNMEIWIGGLLSPESFITATRQTTAHALDLSLEELVLDVSY